MVALLAACKSPEGDGNRAEPVNTQATENAVEQAGPIVGVTTAEKIVASDSEWKNIADEWSPEAAAVETISGASDVTIDVYLGTWCGDSRREVSRWIGATQDMSGGPTVRYIGVDRTMAAGDVPIPETLTNVPTFYVSRGDTSLGRVVETAVKPIEVDIADLISGERSGFISASVEQPTR
jgi:hypothetical protein